MGGLLELIIVIVICGVFYQMFFNHKDLKQYDPRENKTPEYDKNNYITPPKETNSYTPEAPTGPKQPYAEAVVTDPKDPKYQEELELNKTRTLLGQTMGGFEDFYLTDKEQNGMCLIAGTTGAGKTETIKVLLERPIMNGDPIIVVDGKGSPSFPEDLEKLCKKYNRNFKLYCTYDASISMKYNSLRHGQYTELKDKLIDIFEWSEEYYKNQAERFLQGVFRILLLPETKELLGYEVIDLPILINAFSIEVMENLVPQLGESANFMLPILAEADVKAINGFSARLKTIAESELGDLFIDTQDPQVIDLWQGIENNDVIFFSLDSLRYPVYAKMLGRLIIADLKTVSPRFKGSGKKIYTVFDEFNIFASEIIVNLINKTREYGFHNTVACQELHDMVNNGDDKLLWQIWGNTNIKIGMRQEVYSSRMELSQGIGMQPTFKSTITKNGEAQSNSMSVTVEDDFIYKADEFGRLKAGEAIICVKSPEFKHSKIKIRMVN